MQLSTTFRHMDASQAVREYSEEKLEKIRKYFHKDPIAAHAVFSVDINITLPSGLVINAKETTEDMYSSIDLAVARIERQVRKWKDKIRDHKPHDQQISLRERVISAETIEPDAGTPLEDTQQPRLTVTAPLAPAFNVIKEETFTVPGLRIHDAVMQLNLLGSQFLVFTDLESSHISVVYRRSDGNYGLIETGRASHRS
jgi:putative sigma-54 modulation protein